MLFIFAELCLLFFKFCESVLCVSFSTQNKKYFEIKDTLQISHELEE